MKRTAITMPALKQAAWWPLSRISEVRLRRGDVVYDGPHAQPTMLGRFVGHHPGRSTIWILWQTPPRPGHDDSNSAERFAEFVAACTAFDRLFGEWTDPDAIIV